MVRKDSQGKGQPKLYPLFNVCKSILDTKRKREIKNRESLKLKSEKELLQRNKPNQRTRPIAWRIYNESKGKEARENLLP